MKFRQVILTMHRWLGLPSAIVLIVAGVTGACSCGRDRSGAGPASCTTRSHWGVPDTWVVLVATAASVALQISGLYLWWRARKIRVRTRLGWGTVCHGLAPCVRRAGVHHHAADCGSALGRVAVRQLDPGQQRQALRQTISRMHTTKDYPFAVKLIYVAGGLGFAIQGVTGVAMWWRLRR
jgi:uncharacterized iron-regulated membrane protein